MTAVDERQRAVERERASQDEDFWGQLLPEAAELVVTSGLGSAAMLQRKMRLPFALVTDLLLELHELGVVGPDAGAIARDVLVAPDRLPALLERIADIASGEEEGEEQGRVEDAPASTLEPGVSLEKPVLESGVELEVEDADGRWSEDDLDDDEGGGGTLVLRQAADLILHPASATRGVPHLVTRVRQASARGGVWVVDQPVVSRSLAVGRQAPRALTRLVVWAPRGAVRAAGRVRDQLFATDAAAMVARQAETDHPEWHKNAEALTKLHARLAVRRWMAGGATALVLLAVTAWQAPSVFAGFLATLVGLGVVAAGRSSCRNPQELGYLALVALGLGWLAWWQGPSLAMLVPRPPVWVWWLALALAVVVFGAMGRKEDQKLVDMPATMAPHVPPPLTAPMVINALCQLGIAAINDPDQIHLLMDVHRHGPGVQVDVELPTAAAEVVKRRERLAAVLKRELGCVWPKVGKRNAAHLSLYVSDQALGQQDQQPWPLANITRPIDVFEPQPVFTTQVGDWMSICLMFLSIVIGAVPRMGKTFIVRQIALIFALDIRSRLYLLDGKGTGDLNALRSCAHFISRGESPEEVEERVLPMLRELRVEMQRRAKVINDLPDDVVPESKVTSQLADRRDLGLYPIFLGIDETQTYYSYGSNTNKHHKEVRAEIIEITTDIAKRGPALGFVLVDATQNICDETIPRQISLVALLRIALKVVDSSANNKILGDGAYGRGIDATAFDRTDLGVAWVAGEASVPEIGRSVVGLDAPAVRRLAERAAGWRRAAGLLTGEAAGGGIVNAEIVHSTTEDVLRVMREHGNTKTAHLAELVNWLAELRPDYAGLDVNELGKRIRNDPVTPMRVDPVWRRDGGTKQGVDLRKQSDS